MLRVMERMLGSLDEPSSVGPYSPEEAWARIPQSQAIDRISRELTLEERRRMARASKTLHDAVKRPPGEPYSTEEALEKMAQTPAMEEILRNLPRHNRAQVARVNRAAHGPAQETVRKEDYRDDQMRWFRDEDKQADETRTRFVFAFDMIRAELVAALETFFTNRIRRADGAVRLVKVTSDGEMTYASVWNQRKQRDVRFLEIRRHWRIEYVGDWNFKWLIPQVDVVCNRNVREGLSARATAKLSRRYESSNVGPENGAEFLRGGGVVYVGGDWHHSYENGMIADLLEFLGECYL